MDTNAIAGAITGAPTQSGVGRTRLADDFDNFLILLTAQLANQDPLDPLDSNEFVAQLVSFTGVEQAVNMNTNLEQLISLFKSGQTMSAVGYLGTTVEAEGNTIRLADGAAPIQYHLPQSASTATFIVSDAAGRVVATGAGPTSAGDHEIFWDGTGIDGIRRSDGIYTVTVSARAHDNSLIPVTTRISGRVTGVETVDGNILLTVNGIGVAIEDIISVVEPTPPVQTQL
jgi:flagellar basal-body rod modification protein FlgD